MSNKNSNKLVVVCNCPNCDDPVKVPLRLLGQIMIKERTNKPTKEHMQRISKLGVEARQNKKNMETADNHLTEIINDSITASQKEREQMDRDSLED